MCGIAGIVYSDRERRVEPLLLGRMLDAIEHRGPDEQGLHIQGHVGLGMRRLSIIDLGGGQQPMYDEARNRALVFNGMIYNYKELRRELIGRGHTLATEADTETIVHLHEEVGRECVQQLRGMFAFAVWDDNEAALTLAIDRFGIKPLYLVQGEWGIAFASELKALHAGGFVDSTLDWGALEGLFRLGYVPAPRTPFRNVRKLEPAHSLVWRPGTTAEPKRYWDVPNDPAEAAADPEGLVLEALDESVESHMIADVPVAAFLSGGFDSSAVVSSMARSGHSVHAFTVRYQGSGAKAADETPLARALADKYGVDLTVLDVEPDVEHILDPIIRSMDEPHGDESVVPTWLICERVASEYKVALTGTGGDELFGGYPRHLALAASRAWGRVPGPVRAAAGSVAMRLPEPAHGGRGVNRLKRFLKAGGPSMAISYFSLQDRLTTPELFAPAVRAEVEEGYSLQRFVDHARTAPSDGRVRPALYMDYRTYLPGDLLHLADRISMAHSLELRVPFIDHRLIERVFPLPDHTRVGRGALKKLLKDALRDRIPEQHYQAPKRGFVGPTAVWLRNELSEMLGDSLSHERVSRLGFFDPDVVDRLRMEHVRREQNHEGVLWGLLCFMRWHEAFVEQPVRPTP